MKVLVIGDICQDVFIRGVVVPKVNAEAPSLVLNTDHAEITQNAGMVGNVVANFRTLAPDLEIVTFSNNTVIKKIRYVDKVSGYILLRVDEEPQQLDKADFSKINGYFDYIVISDYNKGFVTEEFVEALADFYLNTPVIMDTKKILGNWSRGCIVKINSREFEEQKQHHEFPWKLCQKLIVTRGSGGCEVFDVDGASQQFCGHKVEVADVSGCGDTFLSAFVVARLTGKDVGESCVYANKAAAVAASKHGVVAVKRESIK